MSEQEKSKKELLNELEQLRAVKHYLERSEIECKKIEQQLQKENEFRRTLLGTIPFGMDIVDEAGTILFLSDKLKAMIGEESIGKKCWDRYRDDRIQCEDCPLKQEVKIGETATLETRGCFGGRVFQIFHTGIDYNGTNAILEVFEDITERVKMEDALRESEERFREAFETAGIGMAIVALDGRFLRVNPSFCGSMGYTKEELLGMSFQDITHPDDLGVDVSFVEQLVQGKLPYYHIQKRYIHKEGHLVWVFVSISLVKDAKGLPLHFVFQIQDITKQKQAENERQELNKALLNMSRKYKRLSLIDSHTGLFNFRRMRQVIEAEYNRTKRYAQPFSVMMIDLDYFKSINDAYGHQFGDEILKQLADFLQKTVRTYDTVFRFGGEEFVIICPYADAGATLIMAKRILFDLNHRTFGDQQNKITIKLSIGVACYPYDGPLAKGMDLIDIADKALSKAKEDGGSRAYTVQNIKEKKAVSLPSVEEQDVSLLKSKIDKLTKRSNQSIVETISAFAKAIEMKDQFLGDHIEETVRYAVGTAKLLNLTEKEADAVARAAVLHDLGKIGISEKVLKKPSALTREEYDMMKRHPQIAVDILRPIHFLSDIVPLIYYHHERWDSLGYPQGLAKKQIPIGARIVAVSDVYQALTSDRPYRKAYTKKEALHMIEQAQGTAFDPSVVTAFLEAVHS